MSDCIPFAIQAEIMIRLPTKSLLRFRSVSKAWKSLIDSSRFVADYSLLNHTHRHHLLVRYVDTRCYRETYVSFADDDDDEETNFQERRCRLPSPMVLLGHPTLLGSSQGLFCVYMYHLHPHDPLSIAYSAVLWNPSIRKSVAIDHVPAGSNGIILVGFGVRPHTTDPRLVKIGYTRLEDNAMTRIFTPWQVEVYTLSSRAWTSIPTINQPRKSVDLSRDQIAIDEFMYWLATDINTSSMMTTGFREYKMIVSFDMMSETFTEISLPDSLAHALNLVMSKLKESLVVVGIDNHADKQFCDVWMLEHPNSFTRLYTIHLPEASIRSILGFRKNDEPIFAMTTDCDAKDVFAHQLRSKGISYARFSGNGASYSARTYMETLLLLDH